MTLPSYIVHDLHLAVLTHETRRRCIDQNTVARVAEGRTETVYQEEQDCPAAGPRPQSILLKNTGNQNPLRILIFQNQYLKWGSGYLFFQS